MGKGIEAAVRGAAPQADLLGTRDLVREYHGEVIRMQSIYSSSIFDKIPPGTARFSRQQLGEHIGEVIAVLVEFNHPVHYRAIFLAEVGQDFVGTPPELTLSIGGEIASAVADCADGLLDFRTTTVDEKELFRSQK